MNPFSPESTRQPVIPSQPPDANDALASFGVPGTSQSQEAPVQDIPKSPTYISRTVRLEWFEGVGTMFSSHWSANTESIEVSIAEQPWCRGRRKDCHQV